MVSTIHSVTTERGKQRVVFSHHEGRVFGPCVGHVPLGGSVEDYVAEREAELLARLSAPDAYQQMQAALDGNVGPGTYDALRKALKDIGGELVELGGTQLNVTYPTVTNPEDVEAELRSRVDAEIGARALDGVKAVLRGMGLTNAVIRRQSNLVL